MLLGHKTQNVGEHSAAYIRKYGISRLTTKALKCSHSLHCLRCSRELSEFLEPRSFKWWCDIFRFYVRMVPLLAFLWGFLRNLSYTA